MTLLSCSDRPRVRHFLLLGVIGLKTSMARGFTFSPSRSYLCCSFRFLEARGCSRKSFAADADHKMAFLPVLSSLSPSLLLLLAVLVSSNTHPSFGLATSSPQPQKTNMDSSLAKQVTMSTFKEASKRCPITLFVYATMNGYKGPICMEEIGVEYNYVTIDFEKGQQKSPEYLKINPKGQIPALYDADTNVVLAESAAILEYLATKYHDQKPDLLPDPKTDLQQHWAVRQWMLFSATGLAPAMGNAMFFNRIAKTKGEINEFAIERYTNQSRGLLEVLDKQLQQSGGPFLLGKSMTIADINTINTFTYASTHFWAMVNVDGLDTLKTWIDLLMNRDSVQKGLQIPFARPGFFGPPYATEEEIESEIQRNAGMFTKGGGSSSK